MPLIRANGADLYYEELGSGHEVVFSSQQAFDRDPDAYQALLAGPLGRCRVFCVTARGFPPSGRVWEDLGPRWYPTWADDVYVVARALGFVRFVYTGVSHGAVIGWHLATQHPGALKALVSVVGAPHDRAGGTARSEGRQSLARAADDAATRRARVEQVFARPRTEAQRVRRDALVDRALARSAAGTDPDGWSARIGKAFPSLATNEALEEALASIMVPTLILGGAQDPLCKPEDNLRAARAVAGARMVLWEDAGHMLAWERPRAVIGAVRQFLDDVHAASGAATPSVRGGGPTQILAPGDS
ncbi:MAG: alpha/beta hydrolase [Chloroflexi bacterium]|nr:alpha/beta hydrolase [Chloroflexota bacterium]